MSWFALARARPGLRLPTIDSPSGHEAKTLPPPGPLAESEMLSDLPTPEQSVGAHSPSAATGAKGKRVLACILCQQRKIKCDRKFPCSACIKAKVHCTSASLIPRQRRRRFPERELLDRLRHYESLLTENGIPFEPMHGPAAPGRPSRHDVGSTEAVSYSSPVESSPANKIRSSVGSEYQPKCFQPISCSEYS